MKRKITCFIILLLVVLLSAGCNEAIKQTTESYSDSGIKYTMFIGLNDKDSYKQEIATEDAMEIVTDIALKYVSGFTQYQARGAYTDDEGIVTYENSIVLVFYDVAQEQITNIMDDVIEQLNQNSVLIEKQFVDYEFYEGAKQ